MIYIKREGSFSKAYKHLPTKNLKENINLAFKYFLDIKTTNVIQTSNLKEITQEELTRLILEYK